MLLPFSSMLIESEPQSDIEHNIVGSMYLVSISTYRRFCANQRWRNHDFDRKEATGGDEVTGFWKVDTDFPLVLFTELF